ncbi:hypothetical protein PI124_g11787 [Phytophthora idaei]|nr:hypothetical protein PI125_g11306 [Phytophthora idaei]KAG3152463.1 hypothetical protein PI126_g10505 [Phytophthora idaei]KAG3243397.1 hypothetical protein PI124_g11787 [Phytophthora idaei]
MASFFLKTLSRTHTSQTPIALASKLQQATKDSGKSSSSTKSCPDESSEGVQRVTWTAIEEFEFLNKFFDARNTLGCKTDKGPKPKARSELVEFLNKKHWTNIGQRAIQVGCCTITTCTNMSWD